MVSQHTRGGTGEIVFRKPPSKQEYRRRETIESIEEIRQMILDEMHTRKFLEEAIDR